jgi:Glu-tRNA(Gln) amidotransferase subunit E-like FAD-binding protein
MLWKKHVERMDYSLPQQLAYTLNMQPEIKLLNVLVEHYVVINLSAAVLTQISAVAAIFRHFTTIFIFIFIMLNVYWLLFM